MATPAPPFSPPVLPPLSPPSAPWNGCPAKSDNFKVILGIAIGLGSSIAINVGQNIQSLGAKEPGADVKPCSSKKWILGLSIFVAGSIGNMIAMAFASATILVPLESSQFATNIIFAKFINKLDVPIRQWIGTFIAIAGTVLACIFGPNDDRCFTLRELESFWFNPAWILYVVGTFTASAVGWTVYGQLKKMEANGSAGVAVTDVALPALFALSSALIGGAQMIVHSKALAEVFDMMAGGQISFLQLLSSWFFWTELLITATCGIFWAKQMNDGLTLYEPLFIIPLLQSSYITFGTTASGIFYHEFATLAANASFGVGVYAWALFVCGVVLVVLGILLLAPSSAMYACLACPCCPGRRARTTELSDLGPLDAEGRAHGHAPRDDDDFFASSYARGTSDASLGVVIADLSGKGAAAGGKRGPNARGASPRAIGGSPSGFTVGGTYPAAERPHSDMSRMLGPQDRRSQPTTAHI